MRRRSLARFCDASSPCARGSYAKPTGLRCHLGAALPYIPSRPGGASHDDPTLSAALAEFLEETPMSATPCMWSAR